ncbi:AT-rich interactive domain-containing protein 2 [Malania oleifera]|uniref:AT-rich interactive domain-containing protein 2 n=1 Tax=Malania oleifera TaxID=397392 RepID=UPI0025AE4845|nr:AT-rich interactive domain-containing protein 2 [Malania oleifera]XP_057977553.1 AT-rich interactive domain-containing protein 2 [Malania oleifera]
MAGWPILTNGSALDCVEIIRTFRSIGFCLDIDSSVEGGTGNCYDKLRCLFDQILSVFLKEVVRKECIRPSPVMLGDGRAVDLFKLFWDARKRGGYDSVSKNNEWALLLEDCGLDLGVGASVRLIYYKYLFQLDQWLRHYSDKSLGNGQCTYGRSLGVFSLGLKTESRDFLTDGVGCKPKNDKLIRLEPVKIHRSIDDLDTQKSKMHMLALGNMCKMQCGDGKSPNDDDEKICDDSDDVVILEPTVAMKNLSSRKRKRDSLSGMLNWIIQTAKHPTDPPIGMLEDPACKGQGRKEFWAQALLARDALLLKRHVDSNAERSLMQKKLKMHPSMYEDSIVQHRQSREGLRCSKRLPLLEKCHSCSCCKPCSATESASTSPCKAELENSPNEEAPVTVELLATKAIARSFDDDPLRQQVFVGHLFQAEVPEWTGEVFASDSKWLGTRFWPMETQRHDAKNEIDPIGKGRQDTCGCQLPGSVNCIRFHIAEKRMKLKLELHVAFYHLGFGRMGEEVSLSWTLEEEKRFKDMVRLNSLSLDEKWFWDNAFQWFPGKTRENLVSYYFNVFLVRRRSYQNRVNPKNIDSDDESEFGSLGDGFGLEAIEVAGSKSLICSENRQCTDWE